MGSKNSLYKYPIPCPACNSKKLSRTWDKDKIIERRQVYWCADCGFGWQNPLPSSEEIESYYKNHPPYIIQGANEKEKGFKRRISILGKLMPNRGRLIDIGSGLGHFLNMAKTDGWEVSGVEPQKSAATYCFENFGIAPFVGTIENLDLKKNSFDVLTLWDVLEHVYFPLNFLKKCIDLIAPGGILAIAVPNASGWPAKIFKNRWRYVMFTHLSYFTRSYIKRIFQEYCMIVEAENHTLKVQSLLQGSFCCLPFDLDIEYVLRMGRVGSIEEGRREQVRSQTPIADSKLLSQTLRKIRKLALAFNLTPLPFPVGDLMDLYCRKV